MKRSNVGNARYLHLDPPPGSQSTQFLIQKVDDSGISVWCTHGAWEGLISIKGDGEDYNLLTVYAPWGDDLYDINPARITVTDTPNPQLLLNTEYAGSSFLVTALRNAEHIDGEIPF